MAVAGTLEYLISIDSSAVNSGLGKAENSVKSFGKGLSAKAVAIGNLMSRVAEKAIVATGRFIKGSVQESMAFDKSMAQVAATLGKSTAEIQDLSKFARKMGSETAFTAQQAAEGLNYMALAGYDAKTSMKMLPEVLNLAAAGAMDLGRASDMVTDAASALGMTLEDGSVDVKRVSTMIDQMAKASSKSNTSVEQLGDAILTVGGTAKMMGKDTTMLTATLGILADNGIKGSEGGTALRNVLLSLSAPTSKASKALKDLGVEVFDGEGNMRSMKDIMLDMGAAMEGMSSEERTGFINEIFNKRDLKSVEALIGTTEKRWDELLGSIGDSKGSAAKMAETQLDNLAGDVTKFKSALGEAKLSLVEGLTPALRSYTKSGTKIVQRLTDAFKKKGLKGALQEVGKIFDSFTKNLKNSTNPALRMLGNALGVVKGAFSGVYNLITDWDGTIAKLKGSGSPIQIGLATALEGLKNTFDTVVNLATNWDETIAGMKESGSPIKLALATALEGLKSTFDDVVGLVTDWDTTIAGMKESKSPIKIALATALEGLKSTFDGVVSLINNWDETIAQLDDSDSIILQGLSEALKTVDGLLTAIPQLINGDWRAAVDTFRSSDSDILTTVAAMADTFDQGRQRIQAFIDTVKEAFGASGGGGKLYETYANKMAESYTKITDQAGMTEWLASLRTGLHDAGMTYSQIDKIATHFRRMGIGADEAGVRQSLLQLANNPYGIDNLLQQWETLDAYYEKNPAETKVSTKPDEASLAATKAEIEAAAKAMGVSVPVYLKLQGWEMGDGAAQGVIVNIPGFGQAKGNWNVPYDNYPSLLHRGEMVLNKSQARQFRDGEGGGIAGIDGAVYGAVSKAMKRVNVMMSGEKVGDLTTKRINRNINASTYNKLRAMGG